MNMVHYVSHEIVGVLRGSTVALSFAALSEASLRSQISITSR